MKFTLIQKLLEFGSNSCLVGCVQNELKLELYFEFVQGCQAINLIEWQTWAVRADGEIPDWHTDYKEYEEVVDWIEFQDFFHWKEVQLYRRQIFDLF